MGYICAACFVPWPCTIANHNTRWADKQWYPEGHDHSIPCFVFDHELCAVPVVCACQCHKHQVDEESSHSFPPTNR